MKKSEIVKIIGLIFASCILIGVFVFNVVAQTSGTKSITVPDITLSPGEETEITISTENMVEGTVLQAEFVDSTSSSGSAISSKSASSTKPSPWSPSSKSSSVAPASSSSSVAPVSSSSSVAPASSSSSVAPVSSSSSVAPVSSSSSVAPAPSSSEAPAPSSSEAPAPSSSEAPAPSSSEAPATSSSEAPATSSSSVEPESSNVVKYAPQKIGSDVVTSVPGTMTITPVDAEGNAKLKIKIDDNASVGMYSYRVFAGSVVSNTGKIFVTKKDEPKFTGWKETNGKWQYIVEDKALTGWQNNIKGWEGQWFYFDNSGIMQTGWHKDIPGWEGQWFYFNANGTMAKKWMFDDNKWYYLDPSIGVMKTDWQKIDGKWYYLDYTRNNWGGAMQTGWQWLPYSGGQAWFCFASNGAMYENTTTPDGYYVDDKGVWVQ